MPRKEPEYTRAALDTAGAAYLASIAPELLSGRATLYHGTSPKRAGQIREKGFVPGGRTGITEMLDPDRRGVDAAYFTRNQGMAKTYGKQTSALERVLDQARQQGGIIEEREAARKWASDPVRRTVDTIASEGDVIKARVPTWKHRTIENPELKGQSSSDFYRAMRSRADENLAKAGRPAMTNPLMKLADRMLTRGMYNELKSNVVIPDRVGTETIVGHPNFKRLGLAELGEYIKARPKRFGAGVLSAATAPLLAYDAYRALRGGE